MKSPTPLEKVTSQKARPKGCIVPALTFCLGLNQASLLELSGTVLVPPVEAESLGTLGMDENGSRE